MADQRLRSASPQGATGIVPTVRFLELGQDGANCVTIKVGCPRCRPARPVRAIEVNSPRGVASREAEMVLECGHCGWVGSLTVTLDDAANPGRRKGRAA